MNKSFVIRRRNTQRTNPRRLGGQREIRIPGGGRAAWQRHIRRHRKDWYLKITGRRQGHWRNKGITMVRGDRGRILVIFGTKHRDRIRIRSRRRRNRRQWLNRNRGRRTRLAPGLPTLTGHMTGLLAAPAQAREGTRARRMTRIFINSTVDRLARVPGTTDKTQHV